MAVKNQHQALHRVGRRSLRLAVGVDQNMLESPIAGEAKKLFCLKPGVLRVVFWIEYDHADLSPDTLQVRYFSRLPREFRRMDPAWARYQQAQGQ